MKPLFAYAYVLVLLMPTIAIAQGGDCVEVWNYWSDHVRHRVDVETSAVTSYESPTYASYFNAYSPDGRYSAETNPLRQGRPGSALILTDHTIGRSVMLVDNAINPRWSPDGTWLAYIEFDAAPDGPKWLALYNMDTAERLSVLLPETGNYPERAPVWSPDGSTIAIALEGDKITGQNQIQLYSVPDLTLEKVFQTTLILGYVEWSRSGRYITVTGYNGEQALIDVASEQVYALHIGEPSVFELLWSPGDSYVIFDHVYNDFYNEINIVTPHGEFALEPIYTTGYEWVSDHQVLIRVARETGFDDLILFDLPSGARRVILRRVLDFALSADRRLVAVRPRDGGNEIRWFDLSFGQNGPVVSIYPQQPYSSFVWNANRSELLILFADRTLQGFDIESGAWRMVATLPGSEPMLRRVPCGSPLSLHF